MHEVGASPHHVRHRPQRRDAVMGVGSTQRVSAVRWGVAGNIVTAWLLTIPCAAAMAALIYGLLYLAGAR